MEEIIKGNEYLLRVLPDMCAETPDAIIHKQDMDGNISNPTVKTERRVNR